MATTTADEHARARTLHRNLTESNSVDDRAEARAEPLRCALGRRRPGDAPPVRPWHGGRQARRRPDSPAPRRGTPRLGAGGRARHGSQSARLRSSRPPVIVGSPIPHGPPTRCFAVSRRPIIATSTTAETLVEDAHLDWASAQRMEFITENLIEALAPSNSPFTNPQALKAAVDTAGMNYVRGAANFLTDMATPPRIPSMVDPSPYRVGENIAATPGAVVLRTEVFELIQYHTEDADRAQHAAAHHPADDQQVLCGGPCARAAAWSSTSCSTASRSSSPRGATRMPGTATGGSTPTLGRSWMPWTAFGR